MAKRFLKNKNVKIKWFAFFLFLATIFWVLTKFSKEFTTTMQAKVKYDDIPETTALAEKNVEKIFFDLTANGFEILFYKFKKPVIEVQVGNYFSKGDFSFTIPKNELMRMVASNFNRSMAIKNLSVEELKVNLDPIVLKKVKVMANTKISFKNGFKAVDSIKLVPQYVTLAGPSGSLKEIEAVETELLAMDNVEKNISENVKVSIPSEMIISINPKNVRINLSVAEYSQGKFTLPVTIINQPPNLEIKLVPDIVTVSFDVSVNDFAKVSKENFRVVCDYSKRNNDENFMLPYLEKTPKNILNIVFEPKKIDFFVFK